MPGVALSRSGFNSCRVGQLRLGAGKAFLQQFYRFGSLPGACLPV